MKQEKTLSVIFIALIFCSSFIPVSSRVDPTAADLYVENNMDVPLASANFVSMLDKVTLSNIAPFGGSEAGVLQFDNQDAVTITLTFGARLSRNATARIFNGGSNNQVGTITIAAGATSGTTRIYPPLASDAFWVIINP